jgi:hypothetical protein
MAMVGYCGECGSYVVLTERGMCPNGHPRSSLRGVREGPLPEAPAAAATHSHRDPHRDAYRDEGGLLAQVIGKSIVIVPIALIVGWGVWTGYEQFSGSGMSMLAKLALSFGSLVLTFGGAYLWTAMHKH